MKYIFAFLLLCSLASAQEKPQVKKANVGKVDESAPVTKSEAAAVFARARKVINVARIASVPDNATIANSVQLVTKEDVITEFAKIFSASSSAIKFVPNRTALDTKRVKVAPAAMANLKKLVSWGFIAPYGPLSTGAKSSLSPKEFGDAVAYFLCRLADVTHMPSIKWSPYLQPDDDGS